MVVQLSELYGAAIEQCSVDIRLMIGSGLCDACEPCVIWALYFSIMSGADRELTTRSRTVYFLSMYLPSLRVGPNPVLSCIALGLDKALAASSKYEKCPV